MHVIARRTFQTETVEIDETYFVDCQFLNCILEYRGGKIAFESCRMSSCRYLFFGPALRTVEYLEALGLTTETLSGAELSEQVH